MTGMTDREKIINAIEKAKKQSEENAQDRIIVPFKEADMIIALLKEYKNEYENGFNDVMLGKQKLMYDGADGKWHKKDW